MCNFKLTYNYYIINPNAHRYLLKGMDILEVLHHNQSNQNK